MPAPNETMPPTSGPAEPATAAVLDARQLLDKIEAASQVYGAVVVNLEAATSAMKSTGAPPSHRLLHELGDCNRLFLRLRRELLATAKAEGTSAAPSDFQGLGDLSRWALARLPRTVERSPRPEPIVAPAAPEAPWPGPPVVGGAGVEPEGPRLDPAVLDTIAKGTPAPSETAQPWPGPDFGKPDVLPTDHPQLGEGAAGLGDGLSRGGTEPLPAETIAKIDRAISIRSNDNSDFSELRAARDAAIALKESMNADGAAPSPEARRFADGDHPLAHLVRMVDGDDSLTDEDWTTLHESVSEAFGKALAVAAARQRLGFERPPGRP